MTEPTGRRWIGAELIAGGTNLLVSASVFVGAWLIVEKFWIGSISSEGVMDLTLTVLLYFPLTFVVAYCAWRGIAYLRGVVREPGTTFPSLWFPGVVLGVVLGLLDSSIGVLRVWTPLFRQLTG